MMINDAWVTIQDALYSREWDKALTRLRDGGFEVNASSEEKPATLLSIAILAGSPMPILRTLIELGADPTGKSSWQAKDDETGIIRPEVVPLAEAAAQSKEVVEFLLKLGADLEEMDIRGNTPLGRAANSGHHDIVEYLLDQGAEINQVSELGTALYDAATAGRLQIVETLLRRGADPKLSGFETPIQGVTYKLQNDMGYLDGPNANLRKMYKDFPRILEILAACEGVPEEDRDAALAVLAEIENKKIQRIEGLRALIEPKALEKRSWFTQIKKRIQGAQDDRPTLQGLAEHVLAADDAISQKRWPDLVKLFVEQSRTYADVSEEMYGEAVAYEDDDEGPLRDAWDTGSYVYVDLVFDPILCATPAVTHAQWSKLMDMALIACQTYDHVPTSAIKKAMTAGAAHPEYSALVQKVEALAEEKDVTPAELLP